MLRMLQPRNSEYCIVSTMFEIIFSLDLIGTGYIFKGFTFIIAPNITNISIMQHNTERENRKLNTGISNFEK